MTSYKKVIRKVHGFYWVIPLVSAVVWFITLLTLLLAWIGLGRPIYPSMEGTVACSAILFYGKNLSHTPNLVISDVGASFLKPLFVVGTIITSLTFVATLASLLYLQAPKKQRQEDFSESSSPTQNPIVTREAKTRLPAHGRISERVLAITALIGALIGGAGLILLSGFDTMQYSILHRVFLAVFMFGVALSAILTMVQFSLLARSHRNRDADDYKLARTSAIFKGVAVLVLLSLAIAFTIMLWTVQKGNVRGHDAAAVLEWVIGFCFIGYLLTFVYDLRHARSRESIGRTANV